MYHDINQIARAVREKIICPACQHQFPAGAVEVIELAGQRGVFAAHCPACNTSTMLVMNTRDVRQRIARRDQQIEKVNQAKVSPSDVLEIKNFLNSFGGQLDSTITPPAGRPVREDTPKQDLSL